MKLAVSFTNLGPYHRARLRAAAARLAAGGGRLVAYETAGAEAKYPWERAGVEEPFEVVTLFPGCVLEGLAGGDCMRAMAEALDRDRPDAVAVAGYVRPEALAALGWARRGGRPAVLMSESGALDRPRIWWREAIKARRVRRFGAALVGGPRHRDYLVELGFPARRITLGYDAVDGEAFAARAAAAAREPGRPYFLSVSRFVPEKNLPALVRAFAAYRREADPAMAWDLVLCGDGPQAGEVDSVICSHRVARHVRRPGFVQAGALAPWHAGAGAFVLASRSEPWGLVVNEAAACGLPLLVSDRAGCVETFVPDPPGTTGWRFDPDGEAAMSEALRRMATASAAHRAEMGRRAAVIAREWGPERFAEGLIEAVRLAAGATRRGRVRA